MTATARRRSFSPEPALSLPFTADSGCFTLKGHSAATVVLHAAHSRNYVRKTAGSPSHNGRLLRQMEKQRHFCQIGLPFPRVLASGTDRSGRAFFDMIYVPGRTVADAVVNVAAFDAHAVLNAVENMLWLFRSCRENDIPPEQFHAKIEAIAESVCRTTDEPALSDAVHVCSSMLLLRDWRGVPASLSHGDLTLENIMIGLERNICFIDCDHTWVSSFWLDIAKLFQDFYGHWCLRELYLRTSTAVAAANAIGKLEQVAAPFVSLMERHSPELGDRLRQLAALHLFRALPYAADPSIALFICRRVVSVLQA
ncbi:MAG TPA: phosphotransferase [Rhizomicrobium sp.]